MRRAWNFISEVFFRLLVGAAVIAFFYICFLALHGCSGSQKAAELAKVADDVSRCSEKITEAIFANDGCSNQADCCNRAQFRVDGLIKTLPVCKGWHPFEVCGLLSPDGGTDGHD